MSKKEKYGVFIYRKYNDENVDNFYFSDEIEAVEYAKFTASTLFAYYVEVWKKDKDGLWGNTGEPIWKSDK